MENTNKKRYWLRGAVFLGVLDSIFLSFSLFLWLSPPNPSYLVDIFFNYVAIVFVAPAGLMMFGYMGHSTGPSSVGYLVLSAINLTIYFLLGAFLGWLYGKFKNRKSVTTPSNM